MLVSDPTPGVRDQPKFAIWIKEAHESEGPRALLGEEKNAGEAIVPRRPWALRVKPMKIEVNSNSNVTTVNSKIETVTFKIE